MAAPKKSGLGRGLEALFGDVEINIPETQEPEAPKKKTTGTKKTTQTSTGAKKEKAEKAVEPDENSV